MNQTTPQSLEDFSCLSNYDCPNIGYECYFSTFWSIQQHKEHVGTCKCSILLAVSGQNCQQSSNFERILGSLLLFIFFLELIFSISSMVKKRSRMKGLNAFTTVFFQTTIGIFFVVSGLVLLLYRAFSPSSTKFWVVGSCYFCFVVSAIVGICGICNIALLWIEISLNSRLLALRNIQQTKPILLWAFILLNVLCIILVFLSKIPNCVTLSVLMIWFTASLVAFAVGASRAVKFLNTNEVSANSNPSEINEIVRILDNAKSVCSFGLLATVIGALFVPTYHLRISCFSYILFKAGFLSTFFIGLTVIYHMRGERFLSWKCGKCTTFRRFQEQQIHPPRCIELL